MTIKCILFKPKFQLISVSIGTILFLSLILFIGFNLIPKFSKILIYDSFIYYQMSLSPFKSTLAPYTYRILTPLIVFLLPLKKLAGFFLINTSSLFLAAIVFYYYLKRLKFNSLISFLGVLIFLSAPTVIYSLYDIALVDNLSFLFIALAFYFILSERDGLFFIVMLIGILNKETILFTIPLFFLYKLEQANLKIALKKTFLILIPILIVFFVIRFHYGFTDYFSLNTINNILIYHLTANNMFKNPYLAFGTLWIMFFYGIKYIDNRFLKKSLYILPLIFLQILISTDIYRVLFIGFPIIIPVGLYIFKRNNIWINSILILFSSVMTIIYVSLIPLNGFLFGLLTLPLEIIILTALILATGSNKIIKNRC